MSTTGFIDLQVNGYGGVDYNQDTLTLEDFRKSCEQMKARGVAQFLPTIITDHIDVMSRRLANLAKYREQDDLVKEMVPGIHIEGPFISPVDGFRGAHPLDAVQPADPDKVKQLLDAAQGLTRIVTLAPENDPDMKTTKFLADQGVTVSAGHTDASLEELTAATDNGLTMFTHLGNGCPMLMNRHDNIVQRALNLADRLWLCFIADGAHVPFVALRNYVKLIGLDHCVFVTDAMNAAGMGPGRYKLARWDIVVGEDMVARAPDGSHLVGAAITMDQTADNLRKNLGFDDAQIAKTMVENPAKVINL